MIEERLFYLRKARKAKDGYDGFVYMHTWATGYEELIFASHAVAEAYKSQLNTPEYLEKLKTKA